MQLILEIFMFVCPKFGRTKPWKLYLKLVQFFTAEFNCANFGRLERKIVVKPILMSRVLTWSQNTDFVTVHKNVIRTDGSD